MGLPYHTAYDLERIHALHSGEFGKVAQKLLALAFVDMGFRLAEERAVRGVDIDIVKDETGEKLSLEVKTNQSSQVTIGSKDMEGLESRRDNDGYRPYFAFLFKPQYIGEGWIIVPTEGLKRGTHSASRLASKGNRALSKEVNALFPLAVERVCEDLLSCRRGSALGMLKRKYGI
ncbi:MAG: hypothetical protein ACUVRX_11220 [Actinomycetota bacterium]